MPLKVILKSKWKWGRKHLKKEEPLKRRPPLYSLK
jgi:hypothetical protein